jgi:glycosyltransferase involved in cell wall biosynthesis
MSKTDARVSLVIPVRNEAKSIEALLISISQQTRVPDEVIIVDGASDDGTAALAREVAARIGLTARIVESKTRLFPGAGRNVGVADATGDWIALTDAGIRLDRDWLARLLERAAADASCEAVYGDYQPVTHDRFSTCVAIAYVPPPQATPEGRLRFPFVASMLLRRSTFLRVGGFHGGLRSGEDLLFFEALERGKVPTLLAPDARVYWETVPTLKSAFSRFCEYSYSGASAGLWERWQRPVFRRYAIGIGIVAVGTALLGPAALPPLAVGGWAAFLAARAAVALFRNRETFRAPLFEQAIRCAIIATILGAIDLGAIVGSARWVLAGRPTPSADEYPTCAGSLRSDGLQ